MAKNQSTQTISQAYASKLGKVYACDSLVARVQNATTTSKQSGGEGKVVFSEVVNLCAYFEK